MRSRGSTVFPKGELEHADLAHRSSRPRFGEAIANRSRSWRIRMGGWTARSARSRAATGRSIHALFAPRIPLALEIAHVEGTFQARLQSARDLRRVDRRGLSLNPPGHREEYS